MTSLRKADYERRIAELENEVARLQAIDTEPYVQTLLRVATDLTGAARAFLEFVPETKPDPRPGRDKRGL